MTEEIIIELEMSAFCPNEYAFISIPVTDKLPDMQAAASLFNSNYAGFVAVDMLDYPYCVRENTRRIFLRPSYVKSVCEYEKKLMSREEYAAALHRTVREQCVKCVRFVSEEYSLDGNCGIIRDCEYGQQEIGRCRRFKQRKGESEA